MQADIGMAEGAPPEAADLAGLRAVPGEAGLRATALSLEAEVLAGRAPDDALLTAAEAMLREYAGTEQAIRLGRALAAAMAMRGEMARALELAADDQPTVRRVWTILATHGSDSAILAQAIRPSKTIPQDLQAATGRAMAERLLALGFPEEASAWIGAVAAERADTPPTM